MAVPKKTILDGSIQDNLPWGRNADDFFNHMLSIISKDYSDIVYINGDWNARIGNNPDYIEGIDEISKRHNLDSTTNKHGNALLDFLKESKNYILNGRITPILDDYTSVSTKGKAVVDYGVMPVDCIDVCTMCQVHVTGEVRTRLKVQNELSETCRPKAPSTCPSKTVRLTCVNRMRLVGCD